MAAPRTKPQVKERADSAPAVQNVHHVIDVLDKETERLKTRFNKHFGGHAISDIRFRYLSILAICRAGLLCRSIRAISDEKQIGEMTYEFCNIRDVLDRLLDFMESQQVNKGDKCHDNTKDRQSLAAKG
ncbi:MAG TPA: hypothetical protein VFG29_13605 [Syntrophales bacterium]|nr:hypothetical protein [Syntrophales bacterium]